MTIRYFCDVCDEEVKRNYVGDRPKGEAFISTPTRGSPILIEIMSGTGGTWNKGVLCKSCLLKAAKSLLESNIA